MTIDLSVFKEFLNHRLRVIIWINVLSMLLVTIREGQCNKVIKEGSLSSTVHKCFFSGYMNSNVDNKKVRLLPMDK